MERKVVSINLKDRMRNEELRRRSGIDDAAKEEQEEENGDGEDMWPGWTRRDGHTPRQFGTRE
jgi:hypothetical protein